MLEEQSVVKKARGKFLFLSVLSLLIVMITVVGSIIGTNYYFAKREINTVLDSLADNRGVLDPTTAPVELVGKERGGHENLFQYRYFSLHIHDGVAEVLNSQIVTLNDKEIKHEAVSVANKLPKTRGVVTYKNSQFAYRIFKYNKDNTFIYFLDQTPIMQRTKSLATTSITLGLICVFLFTILLAFISSRAVRPLEEAYRNQQRFITNASHELKTPLAVISANLDMEEFEYPELANSEWQKSNHSQIYRLTNLINHLITMTKLNEHNKKIHLSPVDLSNITSTTIGNFQSLVRSNGLHLDSDIQNNIWIKGEKHYSTELINILLDNANKYCEENGNIIVKLQRTSNNNAILQVQNTFNNDENIDFDHLFERFYRGDKSHHRQGNKQDGYGVGLSMAQDIVKSMGGEITVKYIDGNILFTVLFNIIQHKLA